MAESIGFERMVSCVGLGTGGVSVSVGETAGVVDWLVDGAGVERHP